MPSKKPAPKAPPPKVASMSAAKAAMQIAELDRDGPSTAPSQAAVQGMGNLAVTLGGMVRTISSGGQAPAPQSIADQRGEREHHREDIRVLFEQQRTLAERIAKPLRIRLEPE